MSQLINKTKNTIVASQLIEAKSFIERSKGLLGKSSFPEGNALWIHRCNSIHTFFMKFSLDIIFIDRNLKVKSIHKNIPPWRLILPRWNANSVIEMSAGQIDNQRLEKGDELYVSH